MKLETIKLDKAINKAYFKQSLKRADIELFKTNFKRLFERINETESEEHNKNIVSDFLKNTFYKDRYEINTSGRKDLAIHKGTTSQTPVSVIIEAKSPTNKSEMISFDKPNAKALQETIHYYLHERLINRNNEIKHLIITNIYDWFIFDATEFEKYFVHGIETRHGVSLRKKYQEWIDKELVGTKTDWFYTEIAKPFIENELDSLQCVYINLLDYEETVKNEEDTDDSKLINLYKILSPEHLLKLPFANDYNKIDSGFYNELLHILGLEETKQGGKKLITRVKEKDRLAGSFLENTINIISSKHRLNHIERLDLYGETEKEQVFSIALELNITWLNRVLFLKLLEAQLIKYHNLSRNSGKGNKDYEFININKIKDFDELDELFFEVLAKQPEKRSETVNQKFGDLPYLNSSLFEETELEDNILCISQLKDRLNLTISKQTVLKDNQGNKRTGKINTLEYLFEFLNAYSFSSHGTAEIQNDNRTIINAAVLGLIFEKLNGYKDGSFYTPSFITTYMSREIIRKSVIDKFSFAYNKTFENFEQLKDYIDYANNDERQKANTIINNIKLIDPAVGSGHFLVSALNELIAVKSELKILSDAEGKRIRGIKIDNINDELEIIDEETSEPFQYFVNEKGNPPSEIQNIQKAIFNEKQNLIENCIYGVDINPKSVLICRLRLWIELLKNTFYTEESNFEFLETLPNIDMNIVTGNSLINKFDNQMPLIHREAIRKQVLDYKLKATQYKKTSDYNQKTDYRNQISRIRSEIEKYTQPRDKYYIKYAQKKSELETLIAAKLKGEAAQKQMVKLSEESAKLKQQYEENYFQVYTNTIEWAYEFPEILTDEGQFRGFDIVIGNPPYFSISNDPNLKTVDTDYQTYKQTGDVYMLFIERGIQILKPQGRLSYITSNKWLRAAYGESLREYLLKNTGIEKIIDFDGLKVFDEATVDTGIIEIKKFKNGNQYVDAVRFDRTFNLEKDSIAEYFENNKIRLKNLDKNSWNLKSEKENAVKNKLEQNGKPLEDWNINIYRGITTGLNEAFVIDEKTKNELINADKNNASLIKPLLRGRDIKKYCVKSGNLWLITIPKGYSIKSVLENETQSPENNSSIAEEPRYGYVSKPIAWKYITENHNSIANHLKKYELKAGKRDDKGDFWWELRACAYYPEFEKEKIIFTKASQTKSFAYDTKGYYLQNTSYILTGENLKYLIALLNSKLISFAFLNYYQSGGIEGEITVQAINKLPIPEITEDNQATANKIETLVNEIINRKETDSEADISAWQTELDKLVYQLYDLTFEEIEMIENGR